MISKEFRTDRFLCRRIERGDARGVVAATTHTAFPGSLPLASITTKEEAEEWIENGLNGWNRGNTFVWSIIEEENGALIGQISLYKRETKWAIAYWIDPKHWNKGVATEVCDYLLHHIVKDVGISTLWAGSSVWNTGSSRVLEKIGFKKIGRSTIVLMNGVEEEIEEYEYQVDTVKPNSNAH